MRLFFLFFFVFISLSHSVHSSPPKAAMVVNAKTGQILFEENANDKRHPASMTKKMTLYLIFEALRSGKIRLNTKFPVSHLAAQQAPCKIGVSPGNFVTVDTIIRAMCVKSANDMSVTIAEGLFGSVKKCVEAMNRKARELGMHKTIFHNPSGLPHPNQWTSAKDMITLAKALYNHFPEYWHYFQLKTFSYQGKNYRNHNHLLRTYPGSDGIKTGFVNASGFNLSTSAVRYKPNGEAVRLFVVVIGGNTYHSRDQRVTELLNTYFKSSGAIHIHPKDRLQNVLSEIESDADVTSESLPEQTKDLLPMDLKPLKGVKNDDEATEILQSIALQGLSVRDPIDDKELKPVYKKLKTAASIKKKKIKKTSQKQSVKTRLKKAKKRRL